MLGILLSTFCELAYLTLYQTFEKDIIMNIALQMSKLYVSEGSMQ